MEHCSAYEYFEELEKLLQKLSYEGKLNTLESKRVRELVKRWRSEECEDEARACTPSHCPYMRPRDWIGNEGYRNLWELVDALDIGVKKLRIKPRRSVEIMGQTWARRPGHYNP